MQWTKDRPDNVVGFKVAAIFAATGGMKFTLVALPFTKVDIFEDYARVHDLAPQSDTHQHFLVWDNVQDRADNLTMNPDGTVSWGGY